MTRRRLGISLVFLGLMGVQAGRAGAVDVVDETTPVAVPEASAKAEAYQRSGNGLWLLARGWDVLVPLGLLLSGGSGKLRELARRVEWNAVGTAGVYGVGFLLIVYVAEWPLRYYMGFVRQHAYGMSTQSFAKWSGDSLKGLGVDMVGVMVLAWVPVALIGRTAVLVAHSGVVDGSVRRVHGDDRAGVGGPAVQPVRADEEPGAGREDPGAGGSRGDRGRPSLRGGQERRHEGGECLCEWTFGDEADRAVGYADGEFRGAGGAGGDGARDGSLRAQSRGLGNRALGDPQRGGAFLDGSGGALVVGASFRTIWFSTLGDVAATPLLLVLLGASTVVLGPAAMAYSRYHEREADRFSLDLTHMNGSSARAFARLQRENLAVPRYSVLNRIWRASHPSIAERIAFCNAYRPWEGRYRDRAGASETRVERP